MRHADSLEDTRQMSAVRPYTGRGRRILLFFFLAGVVGALIAAAVFSMGDRDPGAELRVREASVQVQHENSDFEKGAEGEEIETGDVVRTDSTGRAQIDFFDDSLVRLDVFSEVAVRRLSDEKGQRLISLGVNAGRTWNRVAPSTSERGRYEVHFQNAVASVEGTTFVVDCSRDLHCYVLGIDDVTNVKVGSDEDDVGEGECVDLVGEQLEPCDANALGLIDAWVKQNLAEDQQLQVGPTPSVTPSPSPSAPPTRRPRSFVRPPAKTLAPTASPTPMKTSTPKPTPSPTAAPSGPTGPTL